MGHENAFLLCKLRDYRISAKNIKLHVRELFEYEDIMQLFQFQVKFECACDITSEHSPLLD